METALLLLLSISVFYYIEPIVCQSSIDREIKVCEKSLWQVTLKRLHDAPGQNRWLANVSSVTWPLPLDKVHLELRLSTHGYNVDIKKWNREIIVRRTASSYQPIKHDASTLVNPRDIAYYSEARIGHTFAIEASGAVVTDKYVAFVIEFDEATAFPVVEYLSILDIEVCTLPEEVSPVVMLLQSHVDISVLFLSDCIRAQQCGIVWSTRSEEFTIGFRSLYQSN